MSDKFSKVKVKVTQSCLTLCDPMDCPWNSPGQNTGVGSLSLLQGIFSIQGSNPGLSHCRQILYQLSHQRNAVTLYFEDNEDLEGLLEQILGKEFLSELS